ncbi:hypothetical protein [Streptococcus sciuri]|uniref:Membrane associated protein n=1 Tax=Streptococcus sciuri TaxID=2973939 RepID=A0ABT2F4J2_9STRE|nr:hypothetical protein [Streptococcus sciuri]MCS4487403.1 hypothetical protein [Streptococcus sciuri]
MEKSVLGLLSALLAVICLVLAIPAFKKRRYGLGIIFLLNTFTNLVNTIHAFSGTLF